MGLTLLNPLNNDAAELILKLKNENERLVRQLQQAQEELRQLRQQADQLAGGASALRTVLTPLYNALRHIYGEIESMGPVDSPSSPKTSAVWESWKQKLGGQTAEAIDVLALHGEMNAEQLRIHLRCARTHVYNVISKLNKAGIIVKNGGKLKLKDL